jgi:hypothetical protein
MPKPAPSVERHYSGRSAAIAPVTLSIDKDALQILQRHAVGPKGFGRLVSRLLFEFEARREAREDIIQHIREAQQEQEIRA